MLSSFRKKKAPQGFSPTQLISVRIIHQGHFVQQMPGAVNVLHGPKHVGTRYMNRAIHARVIAPVSDNRFVDSIKSQTHKFGPRIQGWRTAIAAGNVHRRQIINSD